MRERGKGMKSTSGILGEVEAARLARRKGYQILRSNFACRYGELDLVVADGDTLVVMEVKTRLQNALYTPAEAVTRQKQERIKLATNVFLAAQQLDDVQVRFDVVEVIMDEAFEVVSVNHLKDAFR